jgi:hypothetical protein
MSAVPQVILAQCRRCSKFRDPREFAGGPVVGICWTCYSDHGKALRMLSGAIPAGCQECYKTIPELDELSRRAGRADTRLVMHVKDGIYQLLCLWCDEKYTPKRRDLYAKTPFGAKKGL